MITICQYRFIHVKNVPFLYHILIELLKVISSGKPGTAQIGKKNSILFPMFLKTKFLYIRYIKISHPNLIICWRMQKKTLTSQLFPIQF